MTKFTIITAMESEYNSIFSMYDFKQEDDVVTAMAHGKKIELIKSGIGKVNAALASVKACARGTDIIINTGLAGGIDTSLNQGDCVLASKIAYHDVWCGNPNQIGQVQDLPLYFNSPQELLGDILSSAPNNYFKTGLILTGDQFLTDANRLNEIKKQFPEALSVDMESAAIAQTCYLNQKQFLSLRIISDVVGKVGQEDDYNNFWKNMPKKASEMVDIVIKAITTNEIHF